MDKTKTVRVQTSHGHVRGKMPINGESATLRKSRRRRYPRGKRKGATLSLSSNNKSGFLGTEGSTKRETKSSLHIQIDKTVDDTFELESQDKMSMCIDILSEGFVQSFVDFFYLTHRPSQSPEHLGHGGDYANTQKPSHMRLLKNNLTHAEAARRRVGDVDIVYESYITLARHFEEKNDHHTGIYFYEKCLEIACLTVDSKGEMIANHNLGTAYEHVKHFERAIACHKRHLELSKQSGDQTQTVLASACLARAFKLQAKHLRSAGKFNDAVICFEKSLAYAKSISDEDTLANAHYLLGCAQLDIDRADAAKEHLEIYLRMLSDGNESERAKAHCALSRANEMMGRDDAALDALHDYLACAKRAENFDAQADACSRLGAIYTRKELHGRALEFYTQNFATLRTMVHRKEASLVRLNKAKVNLGAAKANLAMSRILGAVNQGKIGGLLKWKDARTEI